MDAFLFGCQLFVGSILLMSGLIKVLDFREFVSTVHKYALTPIPLDRPVAAVITAAELTSAVLLLTGEAAIVGGVLAAALFAVFIGAVGINIRRGVELDCGCFGLLWRESTGWPTILRDAILLAAAVLVAVLGPGATLRGTADGAEGAADVIPLFAVMAVASLAAWIAVVAVRSNRAFEPPPPTPENLPPPGPI